MVNPEKKCIRYLFFDAESVHFTDTTKCIDQTSYAMSRTDAKLWTELFDTRHSLLLIVLQSTMGLNRPQQVSKVSSQIFIFLKDLQQ